jgi:prepilin-type N-terminal cleavage/methylation domain-containing protein
MKNGRQFGFSLLELLVVVAVILIIMAIAVPSYLSSRMAANEASAVGCMRAVTSALFLYTATYSAVGYPASLSDLSDGGTASNCAPPSVASATTACLIDDNLASGRKSGYVYTYAPDVSQTPAGGYSLNADPISRGWTGRRSFFTNLPGVIHWNANAPATQTDPSIPM